LINHGTQVLSGGFESSEAPIRQEHRDPGLRKAPIRSWATTWSSITIAFRITSEILLNEGADAQESSNGRWQPARG